MGKPPTCERLNVTKANASRQLIQLSSVADDESLQSDL